jgi:hypothetical protein
MLILELNISSKPFFGPLRVYLSFVSLDAVGSWAKQVSCAVSQGDERIGGASVHRGHDLSVYTRMDIWRQIIGALA